MTVTAQCARCQAPVTIDLGDVDGLLADTLARFAKDHALCNECAGQRRERRQADHSQREVRLPYADD